MYLVKLCGIRCDLVAVLLFGEILRTGIKREHHKIVRIKFAFLLVDDDLSLFIKHI